MGGAPARRLRVGSTMAKSKEPKAVSACSICHVLERSVWRQLSPECLEGLSARIVRKQVATGAHLYTMGEPNRGIYCVSGGTIAIRKYDVNGESMILSLAYPGDTLGYRSYMLGRDHGTTAEALTHAHVCFVPAVTLNDVLDKDPTLGLQFFRRAVDELEQTQAELMRTAALSNRDRFIQLIAYLIKRHGYELEGGARHMELPMSRRDIAAMIGARHETVSRLISRLEADGLATFSGRHVTVPRVDMLYDELERSTLQ